MSEVKEIQLREDTKSYVPKTVLVAAQQGLTNLVKALTTARKNFGVIKKTVENTFYKDAAGRGRKYADLAEIIIATADPLADQGIYIIQAPFINDDRTVGITTLMIHSSGEWLEATISGCPAEQRTKDGVKFDAQTIGIGFTYLARYGMRAILNLGSEDDDGNGLVNQSPAKPEPPRLPVPKPAVVVKPASSLSEPEAQPQSGTPATATLTGDDSLPNKDELAKIAQKLKSFKQDSRLLKRWVEAEAKTEWPYITTKQFNSIVEKLTAAGDKVGELVAPKE